MLDYQLTFQHGILYVNPTWFHYVKNSWEAWANRNFQYCWKRFGFTVFDVGSQKEVTSLELSSMNTKNLITLREMSLWQPLPVFRHSFVPKMNVSTYSLTLNRY